MFAQFTRMSACWKRALHVYRPMSRDVLFLETLEKKGRHLCPPFMTVLTFSRPRKVGWEFGTIMVAVLFLEVRNTFLAHELTHTKWQQAAWKMPVGKKTHNWTVNGIRSCAYFFFIFGAKNSFLATGNPIWPTLIASQRLAHGHKTTHTFQLAV